MSLSVKAKAGRIAFTEPRNGKQIPHDRYISVDDTPWIRRLLEHHEDITLEPTKASSDTKNASADKPKTNPAPAA